jgi:hypothetical protein
MAYRRIPERRWQVGNNDVANSIRLVLAWVMKALIISTVVFTLLLGAMSAPAAEKSYPLRVRGGGALRCTSEQTKTSSLTKLIVMFNFANHSGSAGLRPGEGSWLDRGGRPGEPSRLEYYLHESDAQKIIDYLRSPGNYYTFECFNTGKGYLQVTKAYTKSVRID